MTDADLLAAQHRLITSMPCWCEMKWVKDGAERKVTKECSRCKLIREYEDHVKTQ